jgi:tetratricopeptide (TPR) repeat protein
MTSVSQAIENARSLRAAGRLAEALEALAGPEEFSPDLCAARGAIEFVLGRYSDAALSLSAVAVTRPDDARDHYNLALCLERAQCWDAAAGAFERVLRLDPARAEARLALGTCLLKMNHPQEALEHFEQIRGEQIPGNPGQALFGKAVALQLLGRVREAGRAYEELLAMNPGSEEALSNWIALSVETRDFERARELSERLLALQPRSRVALQGLATVALEQEDHDAAASCCGRLLDVAPECLEAWHNLRIAIQHAQFGAAEPAFAVRLVSVHHGGKV